MGAGFTPTKQKPYLSVLQAVVAIKARKSVSADRNTDSESPTQFSF